MKKNLHPWPVHCLILLLLFGSMLPVAQASTRRFSVLGDDRAQAYAALSSSSTGTAASTAAGSGIPATSTTTVSPLQSPVSPAEPTAADAAGQDLLRFLRDRKPFSYSAERWRTMRDRREYGSDEPGVAAVAVSTCARPAVEPLPPGLAVELPYESQLSIAGRKLIGVSLKSTIYDEPEAGKRVNASSFNMNQELQVRIKGRVGRKINVNVDFDDTSESKRDISVVYKGDPGEIVQEAAFGDINMTLPSTEFVGYSRQLFGVKVDTKYKKLRTIGFFSRTKGLSEVKRFTGNTKFERRTIADTAYISRKYYSLKAAQDSIKIGSVRIYQSKTGTIDPALVKFSTATLLQSLTSPTSTYAANFVLLVAGQDYTVDYHTSIVNFRNVLASDALIAIDYQRSDGTLLSDTGGMAGPKIIKDALNTTGISTELKTYYSLGNVRIIRDNGRGNFILRIQDLNDVQPQTLEPGGKPVPQYPPVTTSPVNFTVDFENGVFSFDPIDTMPFPPDLYTAATHRYNILTEYRYRIKIVSLRAGLVPQSERVVLNGQVLKRDADYFIDYDAGIVTFLNEDLINEDTVIDISYDYAPFGGTGSSTLVGVRSELSLTGNTFIGSSFIYDFSAKTQSLPDIRTTPSSLWVGEVDTRLQNIQLPYVPLTVSVSGEYAMSNRNPNVANKALIESMEGIKQEDTVSLDRTVWQPAATPGGSHYNLSDISWENEEINKKDIIPNLDDDSTDKQQVMHINYDLGTSNEVSLIQALSKTGLDYSKKLFVEMWIKGDGKGEEFAVAYGYFNENVDGSGILRTEDTYGDGILRSGQDIGWDFLNANGTTSKFGAGNGKLDTADLNGNNMLDQFDFTAFPGPYGAADYAGRQLLDTDGVVHKTVDWTGWKVFRMPLNITQAEDWKNIKQVRLTIRGTAAQRGVLSVGKIAVVGNKWETDSMNVAGSTLTIAAINTDDAAYVSLLTNYAYQELYDTEDSLTDERTEQALSLSYEAPAGTGTQVAAKVVYAGRAYDLSSYGSLKFFIYSKLAAGDTFFIQAGGNDSNYYEHSFQIPADWENSWHLVTIRQEGNGSRADHWAVDQGTVAIIGSPSLQGISQIKIGVRTSSAKTAEIWVNEIHVADALQKSDRAWRGTVDLTWPGWRQIGSAGFGGSRKEIGRNFETFSGGIYNRDYLEDNGYVNFKGLRLFGIDWVPMTSKLTRVRTITPSVVQNQNDLLSVLDEGRVVSYTGSGQTSFNFGRFLPRIGTQYSRAITDSQKIERLEDRETINNTVEYQFPVRFALLPTNITGNYSVTNSYYRLYPSTRIIDADSFLDLNTARRYLEVKDFHTLEISEGWNVRTPFQLWEGFTFSPTYALRTINEKSKDYAVEMRYPKSLSQDVGATSSLRVFTWLQPTMNYTIATKENYNLTYSTSSISPLEPARTKYIERSATGDVSWNFQVRDIVNCRYIQSLGFTSSYRIQDSDSYDNVESSYSALGASMEKLWIRGNPLKTRLLSGATAAYIIKSIVRKDDVRFAGRYNPFEAFAFAGRMAPLKTMTANFTYTGGEEHSYITGTEKDIYTTVWPDLIFGMSQWERLVHLERYLSDAQLNIRHQKKTVDTVAVSFSESKTMGGDFRFNLLRKVDLNFSFTTTRNEDRDRVLRVISGLGENTAWATQGGFLLKNWRFTVRYDNNQSWQKDSTGKLTAQKLTNAYSAQVNSDMSFPRGLPIPFTRRTLPLTNRLIFNSSAKYITNNSSLNIETDNNANYGLSSSAEYEVSQNFRLSLGLGYNRFEFRDNAKENYTAYEINSHLTIQF